MILFHNRLLAALRDADPSGWLADLQPVALAPGEVLFEAGHSPSAAIFPTSAVVSLSTMTREGATAEFAVVGDEGVVGISLFMGGDATTHRALVQSAGHGWRLDAPLARRAAQRGGKALHLMLAYAQSLIVQTVQTAACNRHHRVAQQVSRRLLMGIDRSRSNALSMTHEALAQLLGVRREGVSTAAQHLQRAGLIRYRRGRVEVLDRDGLERQACECYAVMQREQQRLPAWPAPLAA
jgi:CRP-like cAMP-binding protein